MDHVIVGFGEVGQGLYQVLNILGNDLWALDVRPGVGIWGKRDPKNFVVHLCIPYINKRQFEKVVNDWKKEAKLVIVHSSVPVGTCDRLGVVHSPICGVHPHLAEGIQTFVKYFGGKKAGVAANYFRKCGVPVRVFKEAKTSEALKLWSTTQYGMMLMIEKRIYAWCKKNKVDFKEVYTKANQDYNTGYRKLGMDYVSRPWYRHVEGPIGGHCVLPNAKLLKVKL